MKVVSDLVCIVSSDINLHTLIVQDFLATKAKMS